MQAQTRLRVSVVGLFVQADRVLLIHQMTPPEPDCWDLPGGGLQPEEPLLVGLKREVAEETGIQDFQVNQLLTVVEAFYPEGEDKVLHTLNLIYQCSISGAPPTLHSADPEIGPKGIQWLPVAQLTPADCSSRTWKALQASGLIVATN